MRAICINIRRNRPPIAHRNIRPWPADRRKPLPRSAVEDLYWHPNGSEDIAPAAT
jgi:hypothetical protein